MRADYMDVARDVLEKFHPDAQCAFVAGSMTRGAATASSDIDLVVMYNPDFVDIHRDTVEHAGWLVELFVHNEQAQNYFFDLDVKNGTGVMAHMVATGIPIGRNIDYARERQAMAQKLIAAGPGPWDADKINFKRYMISCELDDLGDPRPYLEQQAIIAKLFPAMAEFVLAMRGFWRGNGKHLGRRLTADCPDLAPEFTTALKDSHNGDMDKIIALGHKILGPQGGYLQAGYRSAASDDWKNFSFDLCQ